MTCFPHFKKQPRGTVKKHLGSERDNWVDFRIHTLDFVQTNVGFNLGLPSSRQHHSKALDAIYNLGLGSWEVDAPPDAAVAAGNAP